VLNRRHIRVKVMQSIYAIHQSNSDAIDKEEKFLYLSIENIQNLYLTVLSALIEIREYESDYIEKTKKKFLKTKEEMNPNMKFVNNAVFNILSESSSISEALADKKINNWKLNDDYIIILTNAVKASDIYKKYMAEPSQTFEDDKQFILDIFSEIIAPNDKFYEYLEDYKLTWVDDIPTVNTNILKQISRLKSETDTFKVSKLYKDEDDKEFVKQLFRKTILNENELEKEYADKTPNWDKDRIAEIDTIILKMAICEFLKFPSIPFKVTINEYLEIAKEYSTPKSSIFINGILDSLSKKYISENRNLKSGRGLM
jgi:N utilization substance protein B